MPNTPAAVDIADEMKQWTAQNPLRYFRLTGTRRDQKPVARLTLVGVASLLNVSIGTVYLWETGSRQPSPEKLSEICRLISRDQPAKVAREWKQWSQRRPQLEATAI